MFDVGTDWAAIRPDSLWITCIVSATKGGQFGFRRSVLTIVAGINRSLQFGLPRWCFVRKFEILTAGHRCCLISMMVTAIFFVNSIESIREQRCVDATVHSLSLMLKRNNNSLPYSRNRTLSALPVSSLTINSIVLLKLAIN